VPNEIKEKIDRDSFAIDRAVAKIFGNDAYWSMDRSHLPSIRPRYPLRYGRVFRKGCGNQVTPLVMIDITQRPSKNTSGANK